MIWFFMCSLQCAPFAPRRSKLRFARNPLFRFALRGFLAPASLLSSSTQSCALRGYYAGKTPREVALKGLRLSFLGKASLSGGLPGQGWYRRLTFRSPNIPNGLQSELTICGKRVSIDRGNLLSKPKLCCGTNTATAS